MKSNNPPPHTECALFRRNGIAPLILGVINFRMANTTKVNIKPITKDAILINDLILAS